jgi:hypothetical protein
MFYQITPESRAMLKKTKQRIKNSKNIDYSDYSNTNSYMWMEGMIHHHHGDLKPLFDELGINSKIWGEWKRQDKNFQFAENQGKEDITVLLESALLRRAIGFEVTEEQKSEKTGDTITYHRYYPPNVDALKFLLINIMPEKYDRANARADMPQVVINAIGFEQKGQQLLDKLEVIDNNNDKQAAIN